MRRTGGVAPSPHDVGAGCRRRGRDGSRRGRRRGAGRGHGRGLRRPPGCARPGRRAADRGGPAAGPVHDGAPGLPDGRGRRTARPARRGARAGRGGRRPVTAGGAEPGEDGRLRCPWALGVPEYVTYHDEEWGRPLRGEAELFERISLEAFQSGLAWITVLRKREAFRRAFDGFQPTVVAGYDESDVD